MTITDKTILVTGANRGIGQALVEQALKRGANRVYVGTRQPIVHPDSRVTSVTLDVTDPDADSGGSRADRVAGHPHQQRRHLTAR